MRRLPTLLLLLAGLSACPDEPVPPPSPPEPVPAAAPAVPDVDPAAARLAQALAYLRQGRRLDAVRGLFAAIGLSASDGGPRGRALLELRKLTGLLWHRRTAGELQIVAHEHLLLRQGPTLMRLDPLTGRAVWELTPVGQRAMLPALQRQGSLMVAFEPLGSGVARVLRVDADSGEIRARIDLPAGLHEPRLAIGGNGSLCVRVSRPCCGPAGALQIADDLAETPRPPDACDPVEPGAPARPIPRLDLPFECGALQACAGEARAEWLARVDRLEQGVRLHRGQALVARSDGLYCVDLSSCVTLWRLPLAVWLRGAVGSVMLFRVDQDLFGLDIDLAARTGAGKTAWWEPDAGMLEVRLGPGRKAPLRAGADRTAEQTGEVSDGAHLLFDLVSETRSLGQPYFRVLREPRAGQPAAESWIWGGDVVRFDAAEAWTPERCQALHYRIHVLGTDLTKPH